LFVRKKFFHRNPFERYLDDRLTEEIWVSGIRQDVDYPFFDGMDKKVGHIYIATGITELNDHEGGKFEAIKLSINKPLLNKDGKVVIPKSTTKMIAYGDWSVSFSEPVYHRRYPIGARRADFSDMINPEWFIRDEFVDRYRESLRKNSSSLSSV
jgi:5-hydroxyisourate hydrolase-like protein (transthyretin family)